MTIQQALDNLAPRIQNKLITAANLGKKKDDVPEASTPAGGTFYDYLMEEKEKHPDAYFPPVELNPSELESMRAAAFGPFDDDDDDE
jgi:hypothetical protein